MSVKSGFITEDDGLVHAQRFASGPGANVLESYCEKRERRYNVTRIEIFRPTAHHSLCIACVEAIEREHREKKHGLVSRDQNHVL